MRTARSTRDAVPGRPPPARPTRRPPHGRRRTRRPPPPRARRSPHRAVVASQTTLPSVAWTSPKAARRAKDTTLEPSRITTSTSSTDACSDPAAPLPAPTFNPIATSTSATAPSSRPTPQSHCCSHSTPPAMKRQGDEQAGAGHAAGRVEGESDRPPPAVHDAEPVGHGQQPGTHRDPGNQQSRWFVQRPQPQRLDHVGRPEELPGQHPEEPSRHPQGHDQWPHPAHPRDPRVAALPQPQPREDDQRGITDVAEHHPEHHDVGGRCEPGRVDVAVRDGGVGVHQGPGRVRSVPGQQRRRVGAGRQRQLHHRTTQRADPVDETRQGRHRQPARHRAHRVTRRRRRRDAVELRPWLDPVRFDHAGVGHLGQDARRPTPRHHGDAGHATGHRLTPPHRRPRFLATPRRRLQRGRARQASATSRAAAAAATAGPGRPARSTLAGSSSTRCHHRPSARHSPRGRRLRPTPTRPTGEACRQVGDIGGGLPVPPQLPSEIHRPRPAPPDRRQAGGRPPWPRHPPPTARRPARRRRASSSTAPSSTRHRGPVGLARVAPHRAGERLPDLRRGLGHRHPGPCHRERPQGVGLRHGFAGERHQPVPDVGHLAAAPEHAHHVTRAWCGSQPASTRRCHAHGSDRPARRATDIPTRTSPARAPSSRARPRRRRCSPRPPPPERRLSPAADGSATARGFFRPPTPRSWSEPPVPRGRGAARRQAGGGPDAVEHPGDHVRQACRGDVAAPGRPPRACRCPAWLAPRRAPPCGRSRPPLDRGRARGERAGARRRPGRLPRPPAGDDAPRRPGPVPAPVAPPPPPARAPLDDRHHRRRPQPPNRRAPLRGCSPGRERPWADNAARCPTACDGTIHLLAGGSGRRPALHRCDAVRRRANGPFSCALSCLRLDDEGQSRRRTRGTHPRWRRRIPEAALDALTWATDLARRGGFELIAARAVAPARGEGSPDRDVSLPQDAIRRHGAPRRRSPGCRWPRRTTAMPTSSSSEVAAPAASLACTGSGSRTT